jgi:hypothetical protein
MADYLTQDDVDNYGPELINVTQRAALLGDFASPAIAQPAERPAAAAPGR